MAEREFEFGRILPATEEERLPIESFDPDIQALLASGDAIQGFPASMVSDRVGLPTALARGAADLFDTSRREVLIPAARELGEAIESYNPETFGFEERVEERLRPGVFMRPEAPTTGAEARANMPLARGFSQAVDFAGDLLTSPETRAETARTLQEFPDIFARQMKISGEAGLRGERVIDPETSMEGSPFDPLLTATAGLGIARAAGGIPDGGPALGSFGGKTSSDDLETKKAKLQQQRGIYDNRNAQLFESTAKPLKPSTVDRLKAERAKAGREMTRLQHEIDLEENEPNLPDSIITRDSGGKLLPREDFYQANEYAFHGTRGAADQIIKDGGVHMNTDQPAFFMTESPAEAMTYGAGGLGDLGTVIPMRIDTRGFAEIDYGGQRYGQLDDGGVVSIYFPSKTTFFGQEGQDFKFEVNVGFGRQIGDDFEFVDGEDAVTISADGSSPKPISVDLLSQYQPDGLGIADDEMLLNAIKDAGAPGARLMSIRDLDPTGAMMLRRTTKLNIPEENEILTVFDKSRQRLAKGNPAKADDLGQIGIARNPFKGFAVGGMVNNMRRRNISGLTNLFSKYNTSGPLAGAGVPRGTMQMQRGGAVQDFGGREQAYAQNRRFADMPLVDFNAAGDVPQSVLDQIALAEAEAASRLPVETASPVSEAPVASEPPPAQTTTPPFTPSTGIVAGGPAPGEVEVTREGKILKGKIPQPDPLPPPPPPPVIDLPPLPPPVMETPAPPPVIETPPPVVDPDPLPLPPVDPDPLPPISPVDVVEPPIEIPLPPIEEAPLPPPVYTPPPPTEVVVPQEPLFTPPPIAETPDLPDPVMLSGETVDFDIADQITPQTGGYATTQGMNIAATGDPFADAVAGEYQMPLYRPRPTNAMPFLSLRFSRPPTTPEQAPPPPKSSDYSTGSYGRLEFAEAIANWERLYGPVEDYVPPDPMMDEAREQETTTGTTSTGAITSGTRFYPEPPPQKPSGGIGPTMLYITRMAAWEQKYGPVEDYYAAQEAARNNDINVYLSRQGEEAIAAQYGYTVEQLRDINADRKRRGLPPLDPILPDIDVSP